MIQEDASQFVVEVLIYPKVLKTPCTIVTD
jgi:hypothetical protein